MPKVWQTTYRERIQRPPQLYYYYHCIAKCGTRYKAEEANNSFISELQRFIPKPGVAELYRMVIKDIYSQQLVSQSNGRKELLAQIEAENNRLAKARRLLLDDAIDSGDYKTIKIECEKKLLILEGKLTEFQQTNI